MATITERAVARTRRRIKEVRARIDKITREAQGRLQPLKKRLAEDREILKKLGAQEAPAKPKP